MNITGVTAFSISRIKVAYPTDLFPVLKTFVAPMLPDPIFLMSFFKKTLVNKKPNGIDPIKYEIIVIKKISIIKF